MPEILPLAPTTTPREQLVDAANQASKDAAGKLYTPNGHTIAGFDCSGFVTYIYQKIFPHYLHLNTDAIESSALFRKVAFPQAGDLIFFPTGINPYDKKSYGNHVGIVLDGNTWIGSQTSTGVAKVKMLNPWWSSRTKFFLQYAMLA
ncbi:MAG TPA: NlpC/P60 family protein [Bryobacteraceae bacterium]|nr:NlpC/P60 family protein [Bryobacteraceae bacterium]